MGCVKEKLDVVIADDNERILQLLNDILSNDDEIEVVGMARNGEEAVNVITTKQPDVVLVDIIMPKLDGLAVMDKVNKEDTLKKKAGICGSVGGRQRIHNG